MSRLSLDTTETIYFYEQDYYMFSNFSAFRLLWRGRDFDTSEHAYQWSKFDYAGAGIGAKDVAAKIAAARSAHDAFKIAEVNGAYRSPEWDRIKVDVMAAILRAKMDQHPYVKRKLLASGDRRLVENSWRDPFWGWGENRDGTNMLGQLWMRLRSKLLDELGIGPTTEAICEELRDAGWDIADGHATFAFKPTAGANWSTTIDVNSLARRIAARRGQ